MQEQVEGLRFAVQNQVEWQRYAEGKNFILFSLSGGTLATVFTALLQNTAEEKSSIDLSSRFFLNTQDHFFHFFLVTSFCAFVISLLLFAIKPPKNTITKSNWIQKTINFLRFYLNYFFRNSEYDQSKNNPSGTPELISWRYVNSKNSTELLSDAANYDFNAQLIDLLVQQKIGSKITERKYKMFNLGVLVYTLGLLVYFFRLLLLFFQLSNHS